LSCPDPNIAASALVTLAGLGALGARLGGAPQGAARSASRWEAAWRWRRRRSSERPYTSRGFESREKHQCVA
jgi:hypothetical protein